MTTTATTDVAERLRRRAERCRRQAEALPRARDGRVGRAYEGALAVLTARAEAFAEAADLIARIG